MNEREKKKKEKLTERERERERKWWDVRQVRKKSRKQT